MTTATASPEGNSPQNLPHVKPAPRCLLPNFRHFSAEVWRLPNWERGTPPHSTIQAQRRKLKCAPLGHRKAMQRVWRADRAAYFAHRRAERERLTVTPYNCGSAGRSAIPCAVMFCESGGSYTARNPSGAYGRYQLMPEWWSNLGREPTPAEQDRIAAELWAGGAGAGNWVCA